MKGTVLFRARIRIHKDQYSGLFLVKQMQKDTSVRIVYLSELGLSLMDLSYKHDEFEVMKVQDFLNRPLMLKMFQEDFRTLLLDLSEVVPDPESLGENSTYDMLKVKHQSQRYKYYYREGTIPYRIDRRKGCFGKAVYCIQEEEAIHLTITHQWIGLFIDLQQIEHEREP